MPAMFFFLKKEVNMTTCKDLLILSNKDMAVSYRTLYFWCICDIS